MTTGEVLVIFGPALEHFSPGGRSLGKLARDLSERALRRTRYQYGGLLVALAMTIGLALYRPASAGRRMVDGCLRWSAISYVGTAARHFAGGVRGELRALPVFRS